MDKIALFIQKYFVWYSLVYTMVGLEKYPMTKQLTSWHYLDGKVVHPDILINARPLYIEEVLSSVDSIRVFN